MKKLNLLYSLIVFFCNSNYAQQWYHSGNYFIGDINSVQIFNTNNVLMGGGAQPMDRAVYFCNNYGLSFGIISDFAAPRISSIAFRDSLTGVAAGNSGTLLKSVNGGVNWTSNSPITADFNQIIYIDTQTLFTVGGNKLNDSLRVILKSTDGGNSWNVVYNQPGKWLKSICFTDTLHGIAVGDSGTILKTVNGGNTWTPVTAPVTRDFNTITFVNDTMGFIVGGKETNDSMRTILKTIDGGMTWNVLKDDTNAWLIDVTFINQDTGYAVGPLATILKTTDAGQNWQQDIINGATGNEYFTSVRFINSNFGVVAGKSGQVFIFTPPKHVEVYTAGANVDSTSVALNAFINSYNNTAAFTFCFSIDSGMSNLSVLAEELWQKDSLTTFEEQSILAGFTPNTQYYYFARGRTVTDTVYGDTLSFYTGNLNAVFKTLNADSITGSGVRLRGYINKFTEPINVFFDYDTLPDLNHIINAVPVSVNDSGPHFISITLSSLVPNRTYYYRLRVVSNSDISYYGDMQRFYTITLPYSIFETMSASNVASTSATLNGLVDHITSPMFINFEYGKSPLMGSETNGAAFITDTGYYPVAVNFNGLQPNTLYFFRMKGETSFSNYYSEIKCFYTGNPSNAFQTIAATNITTTSAQLNGIVNKFSQPVASLFFEYGTSITLGNQVAATPSFVNDTIQNNISASLSGLQPNTLYYYRLKGTTLFGDFHGDIVGLYTGIMLFNQWKTLPATYMNDTMVNLKGVIQGFNVPANISFEYGLTPALGNSEYGNPYFVVNDTSVHYCLASLFKSALQPHRQYCYRLKVTTAVGTFYGETLTFYSDNTVGGFQTSPATEITSASAILNGIALGATMPANVLFEYGPTESFGDSVIAVPASLSDTLQHTYTASLSGLDTNRYYYFRLKGVSNDSLQFYGNTLQFFTGYPEIPNWDFQFWQSDTIQLPIDWNFLDGNVSQAPGHSGNYAVNISGQNGMLNGTYINADNGGLPKFVGGCAFNIRPDSVTCWLNYNIIPGDTGFLIVYLYAGNNTISLQMHPISGNSGGAFKRMSFPFIYNSGLTPDSLVIGFISTNLRGVNNVNAGNNYFIIDDLGFVPASNALSNSGFENWFSLVNNRLLDWQYMPLLGAIPGVGNTGPMVTQTYFTPPFDYAAEVHNFLWGGNLMPGRIVIGRGFWPQGNIPSFAVSAKHQSLTGYYKFYPVNGDTMVIHVNIFSHGQAIGTFDFQESDSVTHFTSFNIPINYYGNTQIPDSGNIEVQPYLTVPKGLSTAVIDKLNFDGFLSLSDISWGLAKNDRGLKIYPNPAQNLVIIELKTTAAEGDFVQLFGLNGQLLIETRLSPGQDKAELYFDDLPAGFYLLNVKTGNEFSNAKIVIIR